jgi:hypothetical protein
LGYADAKPGGKFIRIGVGILENPDEPAYDWKKTYKILNHGKWVDMERTDCLQRELESTSVMAMYRKTIRLVQWLFHRTRAEHRQKPLKRTSSITISSIDAERSGPAFQIGFPYAISTSNDLKGFLEIRTKSQFIKELQTVERLSGAERLQPGSGGSSGDGCQRKSGAGVTFAVDKPLHRMAFGL